MSLSKNLFENIIKNKCNHQIQYKKAIQNNNSYFYCYKCNNIILIFNNKLYSTYKLVDEEEKNDIIEFDPVKIIKLMIQRQEEQIKEINEKLVLNFSTNDDTNTYYNQISININNESEKYRNLRTTNEDDEKEKEKIKSVKIIGNDLMEINNSTNEKEKKNNKFTKLLFDDEIFHKYAKQRNKILFYIHKLCTKLKYNDCSFYLSLYLSDTYLSRVFSDDITERELFLVILGFFLISSKYIEDDIFEPELQIFCNIEKSISLTMEEIRESEVQCLTLINHNLFLYSTYDWINILLNNGIVFENEIKNEINDSNELGKIYIYTQKLLTLVTSKTYFCQYSSMQIAFSIVQLSREKFLPKNIESSESLFKLLISLYGVEFSDYEECYNIIKLDLFENNSFEDENESINSNINTNSQTDINKTKKNLEAEINKSNLNTFDEETISNLNTSSKEFNYKIFLNSNKVKKFKNTDYNLKSNNNSKTKYKYKLCASPGQINFLNNKRKNKSTEKNLEFLQNNSIGIFTNNVNQKLTPNIMTHNNSLHNSSFNSYNYILKEPQHIILDSFRNENKQLMLSGKNQKGNKTLYINYAPKFLIKNNGPNINNINYINNININNEVINLYSDSKNKKMNKNIGSGLNLNFCYNINDNKISKNNENKSTNYIIKKSSFTIRNTNSNQINYEYNINNLNNMNNNNKNNKHKDNINIVTSQNIAEINNLFKSNKKINNKEKFKTLLLLDIQNMPNGNAIYNRNIDNQVIIPVERENKSCNKYTFKGNNNINLNNKKKNNIKIHLGGKKEIKVMNTNININFKNKFNNRKFTINFKDIVNKKINMQRDKNFMMKDSNAKSKRFNSLNSNNYILNNDKNKINKKYNHKNSKSKNEKGGFINENKNERKNYKIFDNNIRIENFLNLKNVASLNSRLPRLKFNKKSALSNK